MNTTFGRYAAGFLALTSLAVGCSKHDKAAGGPAAPGSASVSPSAVEPRRGLLPVGAQMPNFTVRAHTGQEVTASSLRGRTVVVYFYPKDGTPGCTVEAEQFSLAHEELNSGGAVVLGVSSDDNESHAQFAKAHGLPFLLLPDEEHELARAFGVKTTLGMTQRVTFIIDRAGRVARVYEDVSPKTHAREILADLEKLNSAPGASSPN